MNDGLRVNIISGPITAVRVEPSEYVNTVHERCEAVEDSQSRRGPCDAAFERGPPHSGQIKHMKVRKVACVKHAIRTTKTNDLKNGTCRRPLGARHSCRQTRRAVLLRRRTRDRIAGKEDRPSLRERSACTTQASVYRICKNHQSTLKADAISAISAKDTTKCMVFWTCQVGFPSEQVQILSKRSNT